MADNIGGEVDVTDPRDLADLGDAETPKDDITPPVEKEDEVEDNKEDVPLEDEDETDDSEDEAVEDDEKKEKETVDEDEEEEEILANGHERPSFKEITAKYPKFFKAFPD